MMYANNLILWLDSLDGKYTEHTWGDPFINIIIVLFKWTKGSIIIM